MPKPLSLTAGTANVLHAKAPTKPLGGWDFGPYADLDICGFQEADTDEWHKAAPPWFGRRLFAPPGPLRENTITWSDRWTVVRRGWHMTHKGLAGISPHRGYTLVVLQDAESRETVAVLDTHYVSAAWSRLPKREKAWRKARWLEHHAQLCAEVKSLLADPDIDHVIVLGDFNRNATRTNGYSIPGLRLVGDSKVRRGIDHIWVSPGLRAESVRKWPKRGSDHRPVVAALTTSAPVKPQPKPPKPAPKPDPEVPVNKLPADLPALLRAQGLRVSVLKGWQDRGRPASTGGFSPVGVLWHHTGSKAGGDERAYAEWMALKGRSDLPAPLCHLSIGRDGTVYVLAAGRANHAGKARASGTVAGGDGNRLYVGVECQNSGTEGWKAPQYDAMVKTGAVLAGILGTSVQAQRAHKETSVTGKWDPGMLDMEKFRGAIEKELERDREDLPNAVERANMALRAAAQHAILTVPVSRKAAHRGYDEIMRILDEEIPPS